MNDGYSNPSSPNRVSSLGVFPVRGLSHEAPFQLQWEQSLNDVLDSLSDPGENDQILGDDADINYAEKVCHLYH